MKGKKLETLKEKGWRVTGVFGRNMIILRKGNGEVVYDLRTHTVVEITPWVNPEEVEDEKVRE